MFSIFSQKRTFVVSLQFYLHFFFEHFSFFQRMEVEMKPIREEEGGDEELDIFPLEEGASVLRGSPP